jgi:hypothetical protein
VTGLREGKKKTDKPEDSILFLNDESSSTIYGVGGMQGYTTVLVPIWIFAVRAVIICKVLAQIVCVTHKSQFFPDSNQASILLQKHAKDKKRRNRRRGRPKESRRQKAIYKTISIN